MKALLKGMVNGALAHVGLRVYSIHAHGREDVQDILRTELKVRTIIDAGANIGQSVGKFRRAFPSADIYAFEPVSSVFQRLLENTRGLEHVHLFPIALGSVAGKASIHLRAHDTTHTLVEVDDALSLESVDVETVDRVCQAQALSRIDLLKIDVEGFDLEVLKGAENMLRTSAVRFVLVECGFDPADERHVLFDSIRDYLQPFGYRLFGIYDQQLEWNGEPRIRYANACFTLQSIM
jgi:FkbM family methyltransferase